MHRFQMDFIKNFQNEMAHRQAESSFKNKNYSAALKKYLHLLEGSLREKDVFDAAFYNDRLGECYEKLNHQKHEDMVRDHKKAGEHFIQAAELYNQLGDHKKAGEIYEKGAKALEDIDEVGRAAEFYVKSAIMFTEIKDYFTASFAYHTAASYYDKDADNSNAAKAYLEAATLDMKVGDLASASIGFKKAAKCYEKLKNWAKAIDCYAGSVEVDSILRHYLEVADNYENMAHCYYEIGDYNNALYYHKKAGDVRLENKDNANAAYSFREAGHVCYSMKKFKDGIPLFLKSAKLYADLKNSGQVAYSYLKIAESYAAMEEYESSADFYAEAAGVNLSGNIPEDANDAFNMAAEHYIRAAEIDLSKNIPQKAAELFWLAGECYDSMKKFDLAADQFLRYAGVFREQGDEAKSKKGFIKASEEYAKSGDLWRSAEAFVNVEEYKSASKLYLDYAEQKFKSKNLYEAAVGFKSAANCFRRLHDDTSKKSVYDRAVSTFLKELDVMKKKKELSESDSLHVAEIYLQMGECHQNLIEIDNALRQFTHSFEEYSKTSDSLRKDLARAYLRKVEALKAIDHGYYPKASDLLNESKSTLESVIAKGSWTREYRKYLNENRDEALSLLEKIELKPEILLDLDKRSFTFPGHTVLFNVVLKNEGKYPIKEVTFLAHLPDDIQLDVLPAPVPIIKPGEEVKNSFEVTPKKAGEMRIRPLEIFYQDKDANKYMKASNEVLLEVQERPPTDFKNYLSAVEVYLRYARVQESNGNYFYAGDGYREVAIVYGKFNNDETLSKYYDEAIRCYSRYYEAEKDNGKDMIRIKRLGDAYWHAAECRQYKGELSQALSNYESAMEAYQKANLDNNAKLAMAFISNIEGRIAIEHGDSEKAFKSLDESLLFLDEAIKGGKMSPDYMRFLEKTESETRLLIQNLRSKPEVSVVVDKPPKVAAGGILELSATIYNPGDSVIRDIKPSLNVPEEFKINLAPSSIKEIEPRKSQRITIELIPTAVGEFSFKPLDVSYTGPGNRGYTKGTNEINVAVSTDLSGKAVEGKVAEGKLHVKVEFEKPVIMYLGETSGIRGRIINDGAEAVYGIRFIGNPVKSFEIKNTPEEVKELKPSESKQITLELSPMELGKSTFSPLELFYRTRQGRGYFTSSGEISCDVKRIEEKPKIEEVKLEAGSTYLLLEESPERGLRIFIDHMKGGRKALYVTRTNPEKMRQQYPLEGANLVWVTNAVTRENYVLASNLQDISLTLATFLGNPNSVILVDVIEYLIENNGFQTVLQFLQYVRDRVSTTDCIMLITLNPEVINTQELNEIKKETKLLN